MKIMLKNNFWSTYSTWCFSFKYFLYNFANNLPGAGCIYLKSENKFLKPVYLNEPVHFKVEITDVIKEKKSDF